MGEEFVVLGDKLVRTAWIGLVITLVYVAGLGFSKYMEYRTAKMYAEMLREFPEVVGLDVLLRSLEKLARAFGTSNAKVLNLVREKGVEKTARKIVVVKALERHDFIKALLALALILLITVIVLGGEMRWPA